ncbi:MAG: bacillithiol biosynthesis deacetylase BshB1 [Planctomycetota bacterium]|nr:bacillithiol biosynthesis deacetylase BshB1 [Planctomycetota bacterium]
MSADLPEPVDVLAFGPHPDDVELCAGGFMLRCRDAGYRTAIVDFTRGEAGTRGNAAIRARETEAASALLGLAGRENLGLPDAGLEVTHAMTVPVVEAIRRWRPRIVLGPCRDDRHPDHIAAALLLRGAYYGATIARMPGTTLPPHRPDALIEYFGHLEPTPSFVLDVTEVWEQRWAVAACYASQLGLDGGEGGETNIASGEFRRRYESRFAYWGARIGAQFGEPFRVDRAVPVDDPVAAFRKRGQAVL